MSELVSGLSVSQSSRPGYDILEGAQVRQLFAGKTVTGRHLLRGYTFRSYYEPGGTFRSYQDGATEPRHAEWWIQGELICVKWQDTKEQFCRSIVREPDGSYTKVGLRGGERRDIVDFHSFQPGNPHNL